ncbi:MAG: C4-dicarboxylate ABC transporter permease [Peptococcaceae bacterium BICA1-8]|nr:MAG: C4-dicarboxylate ABC transporter permease [Peptococcaceae bacterium BICA1-8]
MAEMFFSALVHIFQPFNFLFMTAGVTLGILVGCLPGLTATMALAILVPFTFTMEAIPALMTLGGIYSGAMYGGSISAILVNTPGTPSAIATTFDGFPLTKKGMAEHALVTSAFGSSIGGVFGALCLLVLTPLLASVALKFGPPEYFWMAIFGLTIIATLSSKNMVKGLIGGAVGLMISTIGLSPVGGDSRFTFGFYGLAAGVNLIVALIGFFCIPEVLAMVEKITKERYKIAEYKPQKGVPLKVIKELLKKPILLLRSSVIGTFVGIVPGAGGNIASLVSYSEAVRWSKKPEEFGKGIIDGVAASETSNNAEVGGSLVPLLTLGIPGAPPAAVILGAIMLQGMVPGPELFTKYGEITYTFILSLAVANIIMGFIGFYGSKFFARLINIPVNYLAPLIVFMSIIGSYSIRNNMLDVVLMVLFGVIGYLSRKLNFHPGPIVLGMILGPFAENGLVQSMLMGRAEGSIWKVFFTRPISLVLIILAIISALWPFISEWRRNKAEKGRLETNA